MNLLEGIRVLDLSRILAGPWATQVLADFGADVIKVERPGVGDDTRGWGPPYLKDADGDDTAESAYYLCANRGKRSVAIDFTRPEGQALIRALAAQCQVLVENYKVGGLEKYGLDYASLRAVNPALVYCSITGYGQDGPYAQRAGYDAAIQAIGGLMSVTGEPDGAPGGGPQKVGVAATDLMTGMYAATAILAALRHAERTGQGQHIDLALLDTQVAWLANQASNWLVGGVVPERQGTAHPNIVPYQVMPAADGHFMLAVGNDGQFARLCAVIGAPELAADPRYASNAARVAHRAELVPLLQRRLRTRPAARWLAALEAAVVPANPVNRIDQVFDDAQVRARGLRIDLPHAAGGTVPMVRNPLKFSATPLQYRQAAPVLGQHTRCWTRRSESMKAPWPRCRRLAWCRQPFHPTPSNRGETE
ncbi:CaiB/BaiF CoA transferase family protein [Stenotrophomonas maltophilia]|uniref:CaiB/BaiF CoA transferase family protein n=1 Tax=Stenotrophomonas maltophilia TaxID=40324 RepID=UPI0018D3C866|nr:CoA transferase [Stenotrophomonas maltophilia]MBH1476823.1 CoA transferase [Stenotrophomonas maltophilia]MBH1502340.1 CoA transferase [Stenotrophomonas maltophilia]HEL7888361.1 CoA transferase [Stenotrophomonas maltophilia]